MYLEFKAKRKFRALGKKQPVGFGVGVRAQDVYIHFKSIITELTNLRDLK